MMGSLLTCAGAIGSIRNILQQYKDDNIPEDGTVTISMKDLLTMLNMTHNAWFALESLENMLNDTYLSIRRSL